MNIQQIKKLNFNKFKHINSRVYDNPVYIKTCRIENRKIIQTDIGLFIIIYTGSYISKKSECLYTNGDKYIGTFIQHNDTYKRHGIGKMIYANDQYINSYNGQWKYDKMDGTATIIYKNKLIMHKIKYYNNYHITFKNIYNMQIIKRPVMNDYIIINYKRYDLPFRFNDLIPFNIFVNDNTFFLDIDKNINNDDIICPISLNIIIDPIITSCNHTFCATSFQSNIINCPLCRTKIDTYKTNDKIIDLYKKYPFKINNIEISLDKLNNLYKLITKINNKMYNYIDNYNNFINYYDPSNFIFFI